MSSSNLSDDNREGEAESANQNEQASTAGNGKAAGDALVGKSKRYQLPFKILSKKEISSIYGKHHLKGLGKTKTWLFDTAFPSSRCPKEVVQKLYEYRLAKRVKKYQIGEGQFAAMLENSSRREWEA